MNVTRKILIIAIIAVLIKLWIVSDMKLAAFEAGHDDSLYIQQASSILKGQWLGDYDFKTLMKGPGYSIYLALNRAVHIPLLLSEQLMYALSCAALILALRPLGIHPFAQLALFLILLFNPVTFTWRTMQSVTRGGLYISLSQLVIASLVWMYVRFQSVQFSAIVWWALISGSVISLFLLTREEGVWIAPLIIIFTLLLLVKLMRNGLLFSYSKKILITLGSISAVIIIQLLLISALNFFFYGVFRMYDMESHSYARAYSMMQSVRSSNPHPLVPVPKDVRDALFDEVPSFLQLRPFFESGIEKERIEQSCKFANVCDDIAGGWFGWGFRRAVADAGYYSSSKTADAFYERLATEIHEACDSKRLSCSRQSTISSWAYSRWETHYLNRVVNSLFESVLFLVGYRDLTAGTEFSVASKTVMQWFENVTLNATTQRSSRQQLRGWAFALNGQSIEVSVLNSDRLRIAQAQFYESPDVYDDYEDKMNSIGTKELKNARFVIDVECATVSACAYIDFAVKGRTAFSLPLNRITIGYPQSQNGVQFNIEDFYYSDTAVAPSVSGLLKLSIREKMLGTYRRLAYPALAAYGVIFLIMLLVRMRTRNFFDPVFEIHCALLLTLFGFLFLMSFVDATSFPTRYPHYFTPGYNLLLTIYFLALLDISRCANNALISYDRQL